ncbi:Cnl2/NKP2 family protein-domain-containing protein [Bisporella sp. PMI_857]|nr:Cnl2/NKP2 family protein-domain-containing protein [Bisporella sp. PMI_857]
MSPTESTLLQSFLLTPAPLPSIISLSRFTSLFPKPQQSSPHIRTLYRDLQLSRARITDQVERNIQQEVKRGNAQRRVVRRSRREREEEGDDEALIEQQLFGQTSNLPASNPHSLTSIIPAMESAVEDVDDEVRRMEEEIAQLEEEIRATVGSLSDLRYGKFMNKELREQVLEGLGRLESAGQ